MNELGHDISTDHVFCEIVCCMFSVSFASRGHIGACIPVQNPLVVSPMDIWIVSN